jgi:hypothetical protein
MFWMPAYSLEWQVGGSWALGIESFLSAVKWHRADRRVPFGAHNLRFPGPNPLPLAQEMDMQASKTLCTGLYKS